MASLDENDKEDILDVAIVGGGVAGTYASYRLRYTHQRVGLFESSGRIGGRLYTYCLPCSPSLHLELGGMRFSPTLHERLDQLIKTLGLNAVPFPKNDTDGRQKTVYFLRGKHLTKEDVLYGEVPYALSSEEKENQHRLFFFYLEKLLGTRLLDNSVQNLSFASPSLVTTDGTPLHMLTFKTALDQVASPGGKAFFMDTQIFPSEALIECSAHVGFECCCSCAESVEFLTLEHGMSSLPQRLMNVFLEESKSHTALLNHKLVSICKTEQGAYSLRFRCLSVDSDNTHFNTKSDYRQILAKRVILALPVPALDAIQWTPLQDSSFKKARGFFDVMLLCKVFLLFDTPWWNEFGTGYSTAISDLTFNVSFDFARADGSFALMASYSGCKMSNLFRVLQGQGQPIIGSAPGDMRVSTVLKDFLLEQLSKTYKVPREVIPQPIGGIAKFWDRIQHGEIALANWKSGCLDQAVLDKVKSPAKEEDVVVVGSDVALDTGCQMFIEGALRVVDDFLSKNNFLSPSPQSKL